MPELGVPELLIIAVIVLLLFGPAKAADLGGSLGKSIREFRKASKEEDDPAPDPQTRQLSAAASGAEAASRPEDTTAPMASAGRFCTTCGAAGGNGQRFCTNCGAAA